MRFTTATKAPDIEIDPYGDGQKINLLHRYLTSYERATAVELLARGIAGSMAYMQDFVIGWNGVEDESGAPLPLKRNENGETANMLDRVIGLLPFSVQLEIWYQWLVINGVENTTLNEAAQGFLDEGAQERMKELGERVGKLRRCQHGITHSDSSDSAT